MEKADRDLEVWKEIYFSITRESALITEYMERFSLDVSHEPDYELSAGVWEAAWERAWVRA